MKRISLLLCLVMVLGIVGSSFSVSAAEMSVRDELSMPDLGIEATEVSGDAVGQIDDILERMNDLATQTNTTNNLLKTKSTENENNPILNEYDALKQEAIGLGCVFLTNEQAMQYVYGNALPDMTARASISYPAIEGITFSITYYTYNGVKMAKCVATQTPNTESKLVKNYDTVEMYNNTKISTLVGKGLQMSAGKLSDYLLGSLDGGKVKFIVNTLYKLAGDAYPSSSSSSKAKLSLTVSTNSTVVHIWRYVNDNYYMRTSTVKAKITETWGLRDVNGNHYYKTHVYTSYSNYYEDNAQALVVNSSQSYGIYQQYKAQGFLGIYFQKQEVSPFTAALPIHFAA